MSDLQFKLKYAFYPTPFKDSNLPPHLPGFVFSKNYGIPDPEIPKPDQLNGILLPGPAFDSHGCHYDYDPVDVKMSSGWCKGKTFRFKRDMVNSLNIDTLNNYNIFYILNEITE